MKPNTFKTYDQATIDSLGAFLVGQLEQLDRTIHEPLVDYSWSRDINVRTDVTMGHDFSSFTNMAMAATGGIDPMAKSFVGKDTTVLSNVGLDIGKTASPLIPWGMNLEYSIFELEASQLIGQDIDDQKLMVLRKKNQQDTDIQVYLGDTVIPNCYGLLNSPQVTNSALVAVGASTSRLWSMKTPDEILADVNELLYSVYAASGFTKYPKKLGLPPQQLNYIVSQKVSNAGNVSVLTFLLDNNLSSVTNGQKLEIVPMKWLIGTNNNNALGPATTNRMVAYTQEYDLVRFPMVPLVGLPQQYQGAAYKRPYVGKLGMVEFVYPETVGYRDGIG